MCFKQVAAKLSVHEWMAHLPLLNAHRMLDVFPPLLQEGPKYKSLALDWKPVSSSCNTHGLCSHTLRKRIWNCVHQTPCYNVCLAERQQSDRVGCQCTDPAMHLSIAVQQGFPLKHAKSKHAKKRESPGILKKVSSCQYSAEPMSDCCFDP